MSLIQTALRSREQTLVSLEENYAVHHKRHSKYPELVQFKYDQIESPMGFNIVQEARGLILNEQNNWEVVAWPFLKFFNYGEGHAINIDWNTATVQEKVDGSLIILYWYNGDWEVATSGTPDASGEVNGFGFTFRDLFWRVWEDDMRWNRPWLQSPDGISSLNKDLTYMWELTTPYNRVVVQHKENKITLIGARDLRTFKEYPIQKLISNGFPNVVKEFPLQSIQDIESTFHTMEPLNQEGYVVVDAAFSRIKVKHPGYVAIHHLRDGFGPKRLLEVIRAGESSELLTYFPEWTETYNSIRDKYEALVTELETKYARLKDIPNQKDFAMEAIKTRYSGALFALRAGKAQTVREFLAGVMIKHLLETLKLKDITT